MSDWYIRTKADEKHGPFNEQQIRKLLIDDRFARQIQQGQSQWLDVELVRSKFEK